MLLANVTSLETIRRSQSAIVAADSSHPADPLTWIRLYERLQLPTTWLCAIDKMMVRDEL